MTADSSSVRDLRPVRTQQLRLLEHRLNGIFLQVWWIAPFVENAFDDHLDPGPGAFAEVPVDRDTFADHFDQFGGDHLQFIIAHGLQCGFICCQGVVERDLVIIQDFKTSKSAWSDHQAEDQSEQLLLYADLVRRLIPGKQLRLQFAVITKTKTPKVQLLEARFDESKLDRTKRVFENVWSAIQSAHFYPSPSPLQCPGCGYRNQCAAWRG